MFRKLILTVALCALPATAMAQEHSHPAKHHGQTAKAHKTMPQVLIEKRAELNLTEEQIAKLEDFSARMMAHHKAGMKMGTAAKPSDHDHEKMHNELIAIFSGEQREQVKAVLKKYMESCKDGEADHCKTKHVH